MAFAFDFEALKKHPYAIGGAIIAGGLIIFYLLSRGGGGTATSGGSDVGSALQYDEQMAQIQAGLSAQQWQNNAAITQSQLEAQVSNTQTAASLDAQNTATESQLASNIAGVLGTIYDTNAQTVNQSNALVYAENIQNMQDSVLEDQINSGVYENANNNAAALAGLEYTTSAEAGLATQSQQNQFTLDQGVLAKAGQQYNSGGDLESATALEETILAGGNPNVASEGATGTAGVTLGSQAATNSLISGLTNTAAGLVTKLL